MPSNLKKLGSAALSAVLVLCWSSASFGAGAGAGSVILQGHVPAQIRGATRLGRVSSDENVSLSLVVRIDEALMAHTLAGIYGPGAPAHKHFLSKAEIIDKFELASKRQKIKDFAAASGLSLDAASDNPGSLAVEVFGPASRVEKAFNVRLYHYRGAGGQVFRGHETNPSIPAELAPHLGAVMGLSNFRGAHKPRFARAHRRAGASASNQSPSGARPATSGGDGAVLSGGGGEACYLLFTDSYTVVPAYVNHSQCGLNPSSIKKIYGLSATTLTGSGQNVALLELDGFAPSDVSLFESNTYFFSTPFPSPSVTCESSDGTPCGCGPNQTDTCDAATLNGLQPDQGGTPDGNMIEVALDIDMVISLAPAATIRAYTGANTNQGVIDAYNSIMMDDWASAVSSSWAEDEESLGGAAMSSENTIFEMMAAQGQSMLASAGDAGAYSSSGNDTCGTNNDQPCPYNGKLLTEDPASQTYVTAVGGTSLTGTPSSPVEAVWNEGCSPGDPDSNCSLDGAGGGGIANYCEKASGPETCPTTLPVGTTPYWLIPGYQTQTNGMALSGMASPSYRNVPDVSLNADPNTSPYNICVGATCVSDNTLIGGTSAASPLWAALIALINQQRAAAVPADDVLGFANPAIYQLATSAYGTNFNDIIQNTNQYSGYTGNGGYNAGTGYDNVTGWGSFKGGAMISALGAPVPSNAMVANGAAFVLGTSSVSYTWTAVPGYTYNVYTTTTTPSPVLAVGTTQPPYVQVGLLGDETCGIEVFLVSQGVQGTNHTTIPTATYAAAPTGTPTAAGWASSATFTFPSLECPAPPNLSVCSGYMVQVSPNSNFTGTVFSSSTPSVTLTTLTVTGLTPLTNYYTRFATLNSLGAPSYGPTGGVNTGTNLVAPVNPSFSSIGTGSIVFGWGRTLNTNPAGTQYLAEASTAPDFSGALFQQSGTALTATFTGLSADTSYYFQVAGLGGPPLNAGPQATAVAEPAALANAFVSVGATGLTLAWSAGADQPDTLYQADVSPS